MKMKKRVFVIGIISMALVTGITLASCMSMGAKMLKNSIKDYGVYDSSVPESQLAELRFMQIKVKSFNGKAVDWEGAGANNYGRIKIPAGTHDLVFDYIFRKVDQSGYSTGTGGMYYKVTITTYSMKDILMAGEQFEAGHTYMLAGAQLPDGALIRLQDTTNTPAEMFGDVVADAPKADKTPTEFEGIWKGPDNIEFIFAGNTWEQTIPPGTGTNTSADTIKMKGTFTVTDKLNLFVTDTMVIFEKKSMGSGKWISISAFKMAYLYTYSFDNRNLILEVEGVLPKGTYYKQ
jgi:hypothetical protein